MKWKSFSYIMAMFLLGLFTPGNVGAQSSADEVRLQTMQKQAEDDATKRGQTKHVEALAQRFQVQPSVIEELRNSKPKQGWGEITIRLAIAEHLTKTDPTKFPTLTDALQRVGDLRNDGRGWGNIGKELGFKLGPVVSDVKQSLQDLRREGKTGELKVEKADNRSDVKREARLDSQERPQRPDRPERPQRPEKPERFGK